MPEEDERLERISRRNKHRKLERVGYSIVAERPPTSFHSGWLDGEFYFHVRQWIKKNIPRAYCLTTSAGFKLRNEDIRSPDVSVILPENPGYPDRRVKEFPRVVPDFLIEVRSPTDLEQELRDKMQMWIANGCRLGFLIDPSLRRASVYRPGPVITEHDYTDILSGADVLPGYRLCPAWVDE